MVKMAPWSLKLCKDQQPVVKFASHSMTLNIRTEFLSQTKSRVSKHTLTSSFPPLALYSSQHSSLYPRLFKLDESNTFCRRYTTVVLAQGCSPLLFFRRCADNLRRTCLSFPLCLRGALCFLVLSKLPVRQKV